MGADGASLKCPCGHSYPVPPDPAVKPVCPACQRPATTVNPASESGPEPAVGLDRILIEKGWVTPEQVQAALAKQEEEAKQGRQMRLGEALVALGWAKPEQIREALTAQGRTPMRCPTCKKTFNVKVPKPGMRIMCKTCRVPLSVPGSITDLHADETGTSAQSPVGETAEPALADLLPGYAIERKIATGGMGEVFLGKQKALDRPVAIKLLTRELAQDATYVQRFMAEARAAAKLRHENIVAAVDAGEAKGRYYFVMEYVQGETVQQIVKREGSLSEHRALEVARQIARGLKHAHQQGLIHRDIKSANIMIGLDGIAKICDFGLARELKVDVSTTQPGMVHSSPAYASPEQCRAVKLDHRSDMYSLGVTLFEMLTGQLPFKADVPSALFVAHATQAPPTVKSINGNVSAAANQLVARLLKKTADARFKDYDDLLTALDQVEKAPLIPTGTARTVAAPAPAGLGSAAKWAVIGIAATFVIVLAVALLRKGRGPETPATAPVAVEEKGTDKLLKEARAFESARWGKPSEYPVVRAKWKALVDQYRGTPQHNQFAGPLLDFEARVEQESDMFAKDLEEKAKIRIDAGKISVALGQLRAFPAGYEGTPAAGRISGLVAQLEKTLDGRLAESKEQCWTLIAAEKFDDAYKLVEDLRVTLGYLDERGPQFAKASYKEEIESLERKLEEERVFARKRAAEALAKNNPSPSPVPVPRPVTPEPPKPPPKQPDPAPVLLPADPPPAARRPTPGAAELKQAEDLVRDLFKEQYARKTPAAKVELARKMLDLARQTKDDPAGRFVLYREARDLAAAGGDAELANRAIDDLAREYEVNASSMKGVVLAELTLNARTPDELKAAANAFLRLADESIEAKDYAGGERAANNAAQLARRAKDIPLVARATAKAKECADLKANPDKPVAPKTPAAAGEVDLLSRIEPATDSLQGTWKTSDGKLVSPILLEPKFASCAVPYVPPEEYDLTLVAARRTGRSSLAVGLVAGGKQFDLELDGFEGASNRSFSGLDRVDGAWPPKGETAFRGGIFADQAPHTVVVRVRKTSIVITLDGQQVMSWTADYRRISAPHPLITVKSADSLFLAAWQSEYVIQRLTLKPVSGQGRFLDKRSGAVENRPQNAVDLLALIDPKRDALKGAWQQAGRELTSPTGQGLAQIPYIAPEEFDLHLVVKMSQVAEVSLGIALGETYFLVTVDGWDGRFCGVDQIDGKGSDTNETSHPGRVLKNDVPNTIHCSIRKNRVKLEVNGELLVDWAMDRKRLALSSYWSRPRNGMLTIGGHNGYTISRYELIPVTGQGKPLR